MNTMDKNPLQDLAQEIGRPTGYLSPEGEKVRADIGHQVHQAGGMIQFAYNLAVFIFSLFSVPAEVFLRYNFGERYFTLFRMVLGYLLITYYWSLVNLIHWGSSAFLDTFSGTLRLAYIAACIFHILCIARRRFRNIRCYSRYPGDSLPFWRKLPFYDFIGGQYNVQLYLEPLLLLLLSNIVGYFNGSLANFLFFCALSLFVKGYTQHVAFRQRVTEIVDRQIEAEQLQNAVNNWSDAAGLKTDGYVVPPEYRFGTANQKREHLSHLGKLYPVAKGVYQQVNALLDRVVDAIDFTEEEPKAGLCQTRNPNDESKGSLPPDANNLR